MKENPTFFKLVQQSQQGCRGKIDELTAQAQPRINAFFLRTTLNPELTEDLTQDTLLTMIVQITHLEKAESFWPWLYRIAWSKLQQHCRNQKIHSMIYLSKLNDCPHQNWESHHTALQLLIHKETITKLLLAIRNLKENHRQLINMRCFQEMDYRQIARRQRCNPLQARVRFFRAKQSLRQTIGV